MPADRYADLQKTILEEAATRKQFWRERDEQMDIAQLLYQRDDFTQDTKRKGYETYKSNWPTEVVDKGAAIINGKVPRYRIPIDRSDQAELDKKSRLEWFVRGFWNDNDRQLFDRGWSLGPRAIAAQHLLLRGCAVSQILFTRDSRRDTPNLYDWWDPRFTYPYFDNRGLNSVLYHVETTLADIQAEYPDVAIEGETDLRVNKYIYWSREWYATLCEWAPSQAFRDTFGQYRRAGDSAYQWLSVQPDDPKGKKRGPWKHELEQIPVIIAPVRQVATAHIPSRPRSMESSQTGTDVRRDARRSFTTPQGMWCRSIFASVADQIYALNETMAQLRQIIRITAFGLWKGRTKDGRSRPWAVDGSGRINWMKPGEDLERMDAGHPPPGMDVVLQQLWRDIQIGTYPADLLSTMQQATSGFDRAQMLAVSMNHLGQYVDVFNRWEEKGSEEAIRQFRGSKMRATFSGFDARKSPFKATFEGSEITEFYEVKVIREPSLPMDERANVELARYLLDPAKPLKSYETVADEYLDVDDPQLERDKIAEDVAETWPPIRFKELAAALQRRNRSPEMVASIMDASMMEQLRIAAQTKQGQMMLQQLEAALQQTGMSPETLPPEAANTAVEPGNRMGSGNTQGNPVIYGPNGVPISGQ